MTRVADEARTLEVLLWIASLPFVEDVTLAQILDIPVDDVRTFRRRLADRGLVERVAATGLTPEASRVTCVRAAAVRVLARAAGLSEEELCRRLPVQRADLESRLPRTGIEARLYQLVGMIAAHLRTIDGAVVAEARSLPIVGARGERWWPRLADVYLQLAHDGAHAALFLAWDSAGAPDLHRRARARAWLSEVEAEGDPATQVLVVCPGDREMRVWADALQRGGRRDGGATAEVLLTTVAALSDEGVGADVWRVAGADATWAFLDRLEWRDDLSCSVVLADLAPAVIDEQLDQRQEGISRRAVSPARASLRSELARLALTLDVRSRELVDWTARHPWLSAHELAVLTDSTPAAVLRGLERAAAAGVVRSRSAGAPPEVLWVVTGRGMRWLAASEGVPFKRYRLNAAVSEPPDDPDDPRLPLLPRAFEHERGANRAFVRFAVEARRAGGLLVDWRNEAEATHVFVHEGRRWIRPDGAGTFERDGTLLPFHLEYDRGTLARGDLLSKLEGYRHYYAAEVWRDWFDEEPLLLVVCSDDRARRRMRAALPESYRLPILMTSDWQLHDRRARPFGAIWDRCAARHDLTEHRLFSADGESAGPWTVGP